MKAYHNCSIVYRMVPEGVSYVVRKQRCSECGQVWKTRNYRFGSSSAWRYPAHFINFRLIKWNYLARRSMRV